MLARHSALFRLAYAKLAAHRLSKVCSNVGAGFATTNRSDAAPGRSSNRDGQSGMNFNRITTSTNIRDKILQSGSSQELLTTIGQNAHLLNPGNSAGALRALARFFPSNQRLAKELRADPNFQLLVEKVASSIDQLEIGAMSDFCQAIKRAESKGINLGIKNEVFGKLQTRLTEILNEKKYDDRSLFYLYFNSADLNIGADAIAKELVRMIREAPQQLQTQHIRNTLMALATKRSPLSGNEIGLAIEIDKILPEYLSGIEPSNKARIFRDLAALEFQYIGPRYKISQSLSKIKGDLKEGLESFNEEDVLLILDAYHYLPATYPNDLLEIFKDVMANTVIHNPAAVKSTFLVRYVSYAGQLSRARRISPTALNSIFNLVATRLKTDPFMQREIEELCQYLLKINMSHQQLKTDIISHLKSLQAQPSYIFKINCFEYIVRNSTPEANKVLVKDLITPEIFSKLNTTSLRRIAAIIESLNDPDFGPLLKKIEAEPEYGKLENLRTSLFTGGQRNKHHEEALQLVAGLFENLKTSGKPLTMQPLTTLLNTIQTRDTQTELAKRPELQNLAGPQIGALLSALFDLEAPNDSQWTFVLEVLKINAERVTANKVISYLNNNGIKLNSVALRSPRIAQNWVNFLANLPKIEEERISNIFPLLLRLSDAGIVNYKIIEKFRLNVERCIKENIPINFTTLGALTEFLVEHDNCTFDIAQTLFEKSKTQKYVDKSRYRIIAYLYDRKQATPEQKAHLQAVAEEEIKKLLTNLGSLDPKHVLEAASAVLMFPYALVKDHLANLQAAVKDHIAYVTPSNFAELVKCLALSYRPRSELEHYQPLLRDIATHFSTFGPKLRTSELIDVLESFSFCNFKGANVYNSALNQIGLIFSKIRIADLLRILDSFSHVQLKHQDLFEKIAERALEDTNRLEKEDVETIVRSFLRVGYQGALKSNQKLWDLVLSRKLLNSQSNQLALYFVLVSDHPEEAKMLKTYFDTVSAAKVAARKVAYTPTAHRVLAYLRTIYPNEPFADQFAALLQDKPADFGKIECAQSELIRSYLRAIGAEFEESYELDAGIEGIFLKSQNTFVQLWSRQALNYDYATLRGLTILAHKSNAALAKKKNINYIALNLHEFIMVPSDLERVKHLASKGIQPGKAAEEYDFSLITKKNVDKDEPAETESPEVAKKASKSSLDPESKAPADPVESESSSEEEKPTTATSKTSPKKKGAEKATTKTS